MAVSAERKSPRTVRFASAVTLAVFSAVLGAIAAVFLQPALESLTRGPTVVRQLNDISRRAAAHHAHVQIFPGKFRGPERRSYLVISSDTSFWGEHHLPRSDRVQIYDASGNGERASLSKRLDFTPERAVPGDVPWLFVVASIRDVDRDGQPEVLGQFRERTSAHPARLPALIRWDATTGKYEVRALLTSRPKLRPAYGSGWAAPYHELYRHRVRVADPTAGISVSGYGAHQTAVRSTQGSTAVIGAFPLRMGSEHVRANYFELAGFDLDLDHPDLGPVQCSGDLGRSVIARFPWGAISSNAVLAAWKRHHGLC